MSSPNSLQFADRTISLELGMHMVCGPRELVNRTEHDQRDRLRQVNQSISLYVRLIAHKK